MAPVILASPSTESQYILSRRLRPGYQLVECTKRFTPGIIVLVNDGQSSTTKAE